MTNVVYVLTDLFCFSSKKTFFGGAGVFEQSGDVDVYVNGGEDQPGCKDGVVGLFGRRRRKRRRRSIFGTLVVSSCRH